MVTVHLFLYKRQPGIDRQNRFSPLLLHEHRPDELVDLCVIVQAGKLLEGS